MTGLGDRLRPESLIVFTGFRTRRWVVERSFGWVARFRRLARDYERPPETLVGLHFLAFAMLMLRNFVGLMAHVL